MIIHRLKFITFGPAILNSTTVNAVGPVNRYKYVRYVYLASRMFNTSYKHFLKLMSSVKEKKEKHCKKGTLSNRVSYQVLLLDTEVPETLDIIISYSFIT